MSRPLYSGCQQDTVACEHTWSEFASWALHSVIAKKQNRWSTTPPRTVLSGGNRDISYGCGMSQTPTRWGEWRKTCTTPSNSWQHVDWGSKYGWSTPEEDKPDPKVSTEYQLPSKLSEIIGTEFFASLYPCDLEWRSRSFKLEIKCSVQ